MNSSPYQSYASTPERGEYNYSRQASATPTPSPRGPHGYASGYYPTTPVMRPATRAAGHYRNVSTGGHEFASSRPSPRYNSDGHYATVNVSGSQHHHHRRKHSFSSPSSRSRPSRRRSSSFAAYVDVERPYARASTPHGESDEEIYDVEGNIYVVPGESGSRRHRQERVRVASRDGGPPHFFAYVDGGAATDYYFYEQDSARRYGDVQYGAAHFDPRIRDPAATPRPQPARRSSMSMPQRPQTARPSSSHRKSTSTPKPAKQAAAAAKASRRATEDDAVKHRIPVGYSLKNWDPAEEPILLLGSVFDADSLGKWIYDWTAYKYTSSHPICDMAGELWLLLISLSGKMKRAEQCLPSIRRDESQDMVNDFLDGGDRLMEKLKNLLKHTEAPMLKANKEGKSALGKNAGTVFVDTLFGKDAMLEKTERFMQSVRTWNLRFDVNCDDILKEPTK